MPEARLAKCRAAYTNDPSGPFEGRADMQEVSREEFEVYRHVNPDGDWNVSTPIGTAGDERYFIPKAVAFCPDCNRVVPLPHRRVLDGRALTPDEGMEGR